MPREPVTPTPAPPAPRPRLPLPADRPLLDLMDAAVALEISRNTAYRMAAAGEFPIDILRFGRKFKVRTADLRRYLHMDNGTGPRPADGAER